MAAPRGQTSQHHGHSAEQIRELQHAIQEKTQELEEVRQKRRFADEEIIQCVRETEQRVELIMKNSGIVDVLQQLGHLLQEERQLHEKLSSQESADRNDLQERNECITNKAKSLAAEILKVKEHLAEAKARNMSAQALTAAPAGKSKRAQSKLK